MEKDDVEKNGNNSKITIVLCSVFVLGIFMIGICIFNKQEEDNSNYSSTYNSNYTKIETNNTTENKTENITHYCDASGCTKKGTYYLDGTSGDEYYCYEHYKQMEQWAEMLMGY